MKDLTAKQEQAAEVLGEAIVKIQERMELTPTERVLNFIQELKNVKPRTKAEAVSYIHALSAIGTAEKNIKEACYSYLDDRCAEGCEEHEVDGLRVKRVQNEMKVYKQTKEVKEAEKDLEAAKLALQEAKDRAGFKLEEGARYWKAIR